MVLMGEMRAGGVFFSGHLASSRCGASTSWTCTVMGSQAAFALMIL